MADTKRATGPLSAVSQLSGLSRDEVYRRFRLEGSPPPVDHVACVPVYDLEDAIAWLLPEDRGVQLISEPINLAASPRGGGGTSV